jgi:hypothetical protein
MQSEPSIHPAVRVGHAQQRVADPERALPEALADIAAALTLRRISVWDVDART